MIYKLVPALAVGAALALTSIPAQAQPSRPFVPHADSGATMPAADRHFDTTNSRGGITVKVPARVTVYNKAKAHVVPKVSISRSAHKQFRSRTITVWSGRHRIAVGTGVRLKIGTYTVRTSVRYHAYKYVTKYRTVVTKTLHEGGYPDGTTCTVTAVSSSMGDGINDVIDSASCTNTAYPGQTVTVSGGELSDVPQGDDLTVYTVGQQVTTNETVYFDDFYTTSSRQVAYQVKTYTGYGTYTTPKHKLVVHDGGYQRMFTGVGDEWGTDFTTRYFTVPRHWVLAYSYDCSNTSIDSGNWILDVHRQGDPPYEDVNLSNDISSGDTHGWRVTGSGRYRLHVFTECIWAIVVRWK